ncbi:MAG: beta-N-acetylhexosaminidase, partial [Bacteroidetes bacterium]|nr:beta-N-acetylhexosaminidase [Bacteroidota bacterium]
IDNNYPIVKIYQTFHFNKATGKKITLNKQPSPSYPGNGAFTLVDGVQNEKGLMHRKEFLGFNGADCDALIDLGSFNDITSVTIHAFKQTGSWIWQPLNVEAFSSVDGMYFSSLGITDHYTETKDGNLIYKLSFDPMNTHYVRVVIKNQGPIDPGYPGAGNKAWLFVDEIEVN